jgi:hypothetical protein
MLHTIFLILGGLFMIAGGMGFFVSFWSTPPDPKNASTSDWASLTGVGYPVSHRNDCDHSGGP